MGIALKFGISATIVVLKIKFHSALPCEILPIFNATLVVLSQISPLPMLLLVLICNISDYSMIHYLM